MNILLVLLIFLCLNQVLLSVAQDSNCDRRIFKFLSHYIKIGKWCYFLHNRDTTSANRVFNATHFIFDIDIANAACKKLRVADLLLSVTNQEENSLLHSHFKKVAKDNNFAYLALGLTQVNSTIGSTYRWADGANLTYQPESWLAKGNYSVYTRHDLASENGSWENVIDVVPEKNRVGVVCKERNVKDVKDMFKDPSSNVCGEKNLTNMYGRMIFNNESCYFELRGGWFLSYQGNDGKGRYFNVTRSRQMCALYNATLPIIHSYEEMLFLLNDFPKKGNYSVMVLGMRQTKVANGYEYKWDDNSSVDFEGVWPNKFESASYGRTLINLEGSPTWFNTEWGSIHRPHGMTMVLCKQQLPFAADITTPPPLAKYPSVCALGKTTTYPKVAVFNSTFCYFTVNGSTNATNKQTPAAHSFLYNIWEAIQICKRAGATLPIINSEAQYKFISSTFFNEDFLLDLDDKNEVRYLALGIKQATNVTVYKWADNSSLNYEPSKWVNKDKYAYFTRMLLNATSWHNEMDDKALGLTGVLCQQEHLSETITTTTTRRPITALTTTTKPVPSTTSTSTTASSTSSAKLTTTTKIEILESTPTKFIPTASVPTVCESKDASLYHLRKMFKIESCYFMVKGATLMSNGRKSGKFFFNIAKAREICKTYNATLPVINSHDEHVFLSKGLRTEIDALVIDGLRSEIQGSTSSRWLIGLGLEQIKSGDGGYQYRWDDNTMVDFEAEWQTKFQPASYTVMELMFSFDRTPGWINIFSGSYPFGEGSEGATMVICKQKYHSATTSTPVPKTAPSKCALGDTKAYPKTLVFNGKICYFTVHGSTAATHHGGHIQFDIWTARAICKEAGATLPIIQSADEHKFVMSNFNSTDFQWNEVKLDLQESRKIQFLALDLKQTSKISKYEWSDKSPLNYEPLTWVNKDKYAYFTKMSLNTTAWYNDMDSLGAPTGVLCRQPHLSKSTVPPSPPTVTSDKIVWYKNWEISKIINDSYTIMKPSTAVSGKHITTNSSVFPGIKCDRPNKTIYPNTALYHKHGQSVCYFTVAGVTSGLNFGKNMFPISMARIWCEIFDATLPIIKHKEEAETIVKTFRPSDFYEKSRPMEFEGLALGMRVEVSQNKIVYKWRDNSNVDYKIPDAWDHSDVKVEDDLGASFVVLVTDFKTPKSKNIFWKTYRNGTISKHIAFLCQQRYNATSSTNQGYLGKGVKVMGDPQSSGWHATLDAMLYTYLMISLIVISVGVLKMVF